jgi:quercetin dioxygenase-like cupin family protein
VTSIFRVDPQDLPWYEYGDAPEGVAKIRVKALTIGAPDVPSAQLVEYPPGQTDPVHHHDTGEVMVVVDGELWLDGSCNGTGSLVYIARDVDYALVAGPSGARFFRIVVP